MAFYSIEDFGFWSQDLGCPTIPDEDPGLELENSFHLLDMLSLHGTYIVTDWGLLDGRLFCLLCMFFPPPPRGLFERRIFIKGIKPAGFGGRVLRRYLPRAGGVRLVATHHLGVCLFYTVVN